MVTKQCLAAVVDSNPDLSYNGFRYNRFHIDKTPAERKKLFEADRETLKKDGFREFALCCDWLKQCVKRQTINQELGSYSMKHAVERWARRQGRSDCYVSNGAFIAAAIHLGFDCKPEFDSPNALFNISSKSVAIQEDRKARE